MASPANDSRNSSSKGSSSFLPSELACPSNLQKIQQRKIQVQNYPQAKKLEKIGIYSSCKVDGCKCNGWKRTSSQLGTRAVFPCKIHVEDAITFCPAMLSILRI